jgi:hypothetical protein
MKASLRATRLIFGRSGLGSENRLTEYRRQHIGFLDWSTSVRCTFTTLPTDQIENEKPPVINNSMSQRLKDAVESNNSPLAYDLLCSMINKEKNGGDPKPEFRDFARVLSGLRYMKGRKSADMATYTLEQLLIHIDEKRFSHYHDISRQVKRVITVLMTCTTAPARVKLKHIRDIFNIAHLSSTILADVESRSDFTPRRDIYNIVLNSYVQTTLVASQAHRLGEDYQETLNLASTAADAAESLLTRMMESTSERGRPDLSSYKFLLTAWCNVPSPDASDRILLILNAIEENFSPVDASIYSMVFNALAQAAPLIEYDPADPNIPANKAVDLLQRLLLLENNRPPPVDAMCFASVLNALAKSKAPHIFGDLSPAHLAEEILKWSYYRGTKRLLLRKHDRCVDTPRRRKCWRLKGRESLATFRKTRGGQDCERWPSTASHHVVQHGYVCLVQKYIKRCT